MLSLFVHYFIYYYRQWCWNYENVIRIDFFSNKWTINCAIMFSCVKLSHLIYCIIECNMSRSNELNLLAHVKFEVKNPSFLSVILWYHLNFRWNGSSSKKYDRTVGNVNVTFETTQPLKNMTCIMYMSNNKFQIKFNGEISRKKGERIREI